MGQVAPTATGDLITRLMTATWRPRTPLREAETRRSALPVDVELDGTRLAALQWGEGPVVLLAHGWILPAFEDLRPGTDLSGPAISSISTDWVPFPLPSPEVLAEAPEDSDGVMPVSLLVTVTETDQGQGRQLFLRLSQVLEASKDDIAEILKAPLTPSESDTN